jgi:hypothetical protein
MSFLPRGEYRPIPRPGEEVEWQSPEWWDWFDRLDHSFCTRVYEDGEIHHDDPTGSRSCRSMHCPKCGRSVGGQGHLDENGTCPDIVAWNAAHPNDQF